MLGPHRRNCFSLESRDDVGQVGQPVGVVLDGLAGTSPSEGSAWRLAYLGEPWEPGARGNEGWALLCRDVSCLYNILLLSGMDAGDSARLLLRGETCLKMEHMVYYLWLLQRCLVGLLDAGLPSGGTAQRP